MHRRSWLVAPVLGALVIVAPLAAQAATSPASHVPAKATSARVQTSAATTAKTSASPAQATPATPAPATSTAPAKAAPAKAAPATPRVDLNTASKEELVKLPGIGEAIAAKIVADRPFKTKRELLSRGIVNRAEYAKLAPHVTAKQAPAEAVKK